MFSPSSPRARWARRSAHITKDKHTQAHVFSLLATRTLGSPLGTHHKRQTHASTCFLPPRHAHAGLAARHTSQKTNTRKHMFSPSSPRARWARRSAHITKDKHTH